jgi:hypothetical protein
MYVETAMENDSTGLGMSTDLFFDSSGMANSFHFLMVVEAW